MTAKELLDLSLGELDDSAIVFLKDKLVGDYLDFSYVDPESFDRAVFMEKLCDYLEKVELKTGDSINVILQKYMSGMKNLAGKRVAREVRVKKGEPHKPVPRAREYYEKARDIRYSKDPSFEQRIEFVKIILCLYMSEINEKNYMIFDFDDSVESINIDRILLSMKSEVVEGRVGRKKMFDLTSKYGIDMCTLILTIIFYVYMINHKTETAEEEKDDSEDSK